MAVPQDVWHPVALWLLGFSNVPGSVTQLLGQLVNHILSSKTKLENMKTKGFQFEDRYFQYKRSEITTKKYIIIVFPRTGRGATRNFLRV